MTDALLFVLWAAFFTLTCFGIDLIIRATGRIAARRARARRRVPAPMVVLVTMRGNRDDRDRWIN